METFSFSPPINLSEEGNWLLAVTSFETTNSVFNITNENNSFSITIPGHWTSKSAEKTIEINKLLELRSQNDFELHVEELNKRGNQFLIADKEFKLSDLDSHKDDIPEEYINAEYSDLEDFVYRMQLTYDEIVDILDVNYIPSKIIGYGIESGIYELSDFNKTVEYFLPDNVEVIITIDDIRLKSNLNNNNQTLIFTKKFFFYTILGFNESHSGVLGDMQGFIRIKPGTYKSDKRTNITGIDKIHLKCDCKNGSILNGVRESFLLSFALDKSPGHKIFKEPTVKLFFENLTEI